MLVLCNFRSLHHATILAASGLYRHGSSCHTIKVPQLPAVDLKGDWGYKQNAQLRSSAILRGRSLRPDREEVQPALSGMRTVYLPLLILLHGRSTLKKRKKMTIQQQFVPCCAARESAVPTSRGESWELSRLAYFWKNLFARKSF